MQMAQWLCFDFNLGPWDKTLLTNIFSIIFCNIIRHIFLRNSEGNQPVNGIIMWKYVKYLHDQNYFMIAVWLLMNQQISNICLWFYDIKCKCVYQAYNVLGVVRLPDQQDRAEYRLQTYFQIQTLHFLQVTKHEN